LENFEKLLNSEISEEIKSLNTFKTNNVDDLKSSLSILSYSGSSNLNEMFFNSPLSIDKIFNPNEDYILITDI